MCEGMVAVTRLTEAAMRMPITEPLKPPISAVSFMMMDRSVAGEQPHGMVEIHVVIEEGAE